MPKYCKKCGAVIEADDKFCRKCGKEISQKPFFIDKRRLAIQSFYLALGSIALYISISLIAITIYYSTIESEFLSEYVGRYFIGFILTLIAGILSIITYHGFLHSKKYPRFTGIIGCILLLSFVIYWFIDYFDFDYIAYSVAETSILIASIVLLAVTLIFWKRLV